MHDAVASYDHDLLEIVELDTDLDDENEEDVDQTTDEFIPLEHEADPFSHFSLNNSNTLVNIPIQEQFYKVHTPPPDLVSLM